MIPVQNGSGNNKVSISTIRGGLQPSGDYALKSEVETAITEINSSIGDVSSIIDDINAEEV